MLKLTTSLIADLARRRAELGMSFAALAERSGVSEPTVKRVFARDRGGAEAASLGTILAIAEALGLSLGLTGEDAEAFRSRQAREKAERIARLVQGTSGLEGQAVDDAQFERLVERSYHELMAGPARRLWSA